MEFEDAQPMRSRPSVWMAPPNALTLEERDVHIWRADLNCHHPVLLRLCETLSMDEQLRAERFFFTKDRQSFITARGILRDILSRYVDVSAERLVFCYTLHGKPELAGVCAESQLRFNVSHSDQMAIYAISRRRVGVDIERIRVIPDAESIASRFFSATERAALQTIPETERMIGFLTCWTRKEAYIKARGEGLSMGLDSFDVSILRTQPAKILSSRSYPSDENCWHLEELHPDDRYIASLAVEGQDSRFMLWEWTGAAPLGEPA